VGSHISYAIVNCVQSNGKQGNFLDFIFLVSRGFHSFLALLKEKNCLLIYFFVLQFFVKIFWVQMTMLLQIPWLMIEIAHLFDLNVV